MIGNLPKMSPEDNKNKEMPIAKDKWGIKFRWWQWILFWFIASVVIRFIGTYIANAY